MSNVKRIKLNELRHFRTKDYAPIFIAIKQAYRLSPHCQSSFYYIGHFARFVQPGAQRILCAASKQDLETTAFINPDGSTVIIVMNRTEEVIRFGLRIDDNHCLPELALPARAIASYLFV